MTLNDLLKQVPDQASVLRLSPGDQYLVVMNVNAVSGASAELLLQDFTNMGAGAVILLTHGPVQDSFAMFEVQK